MFDKISAGYDTFNYVASFGLDKSWRYELAKNLANKKDLKVIDIATGTGDVILALFRAHCDIKAAVGIDISANMLAIAERKLSNTGLKGKVSFALASSLELPFSDGEFDVATCAFGIRNFSDTVKGLREICRVLKPQGTVLILEFSRPENFILKKLFTFYLKIIIPLIGRIITGDSDAYHYLSRTIQSFVCGRDFCRIMQNAGFVNTKAKPLTLGVVTLYSAVKPAITET